MPSLEIICVGQLEPTVFSDLTFEILSERKLVSHRSPNPRFQSDFDKLDGCIYHLLDSRGVTAYDLLKRDWYGEGADPDGADDNVQFRMEYAGSAYRLLQVLLNASPVGRVLFTTDYQFGPAGVQRHGPLSLRAFWELHNAGGVRMNAAYWIVRNS